MVAALSSAVVVAPAQPLIAAAATFAEQQGRHGANTFTNYHNASGKGPRVEPAAWVQVSCKVHDPYIASANPDGYWYRLAGAPWNDQYYAVANTFMNGDPWGGPFTHNTDFNVPDCGAAPNPLPPPPVPSPSVSLARGPAAPQGYWYAISLDHFAGNVGVNISCRDSKDTGGFRTFALTTDGSGHAGTQGGCYSGDGPDHWVLANGVESNHVAWSVAVPPPAPPAGNGGGSGGGHPGPQSPPPSSPSQASKSVFYSGTDSPNGAAKEDVADHNFGRSEWAVGDCKPDGAIRFQDEGISTLAGWSKGRLGPIYFLKAAGEQRTSKIHTIILFDPGSTADIARPNLLHRLVHDTCDWRYDINGLLATWLRANASNRLIVLTGEKSEEKGADDKPRYLGLWKYYFAGIWALDKPTKMRAQVCDYDEMNHERLMEKFAYIVKNPPPSGCPASPGPHLTPWNP